jgi:hypothetical protein
MMRTSRSQIAPPCESGYDVYLCKISNVEEYRCFTNLSSAESGCRDAPGDHLVGGPVACANLDADTDDAWTPGSFVNYNTSTGKYEVNQYFLDTLLAHPRQLLYDGARLEWDTDHFYFDGITTGDLAQELGFQNGDKLYAVNGNSISTMAEAFDAFDAVYHGYSTGNLSFSVTISRSNSVITLQYIVIE